MFLLYDILLHLSLLLLIPYFLFKMLFVGKYRKGIWERFGFIGEDKLKKLFANCAECHGKKIIWFHAVSVGETKAALPLVRLLKEKYPDRKVVFSTVTPTGNAVAEKEGCQWIDSLIYFPLDFNWVVNKVVRLIKPSVFVVVEKEIWPNILRVLKKDKVPVLVVNGVISDRSFERYKLFGFFFIRIFKNISAFLSQTKKDSDKAIALGIEAQRVMLTGNMKFDITPPLWHHSEREAFMQGLGINGSDRIIVAGSTHAGEEEIILNVFQRLKREFPNLRLILAPRHPERFNEVEKLIKETGFSMVKRSQESEVRSQEKDINPEVILLDTIGELSMIYSFATAAFVGGTLANIGGHNLLEPAFYKKPVIYGPSIKSCFEMAEMLESAGGAIRINNEEALFENIRKLLLDETYRQNIGNAAYSVVEANKGATEKCLKVLESYLQ